MKSHSILLAFVPIYIFIIFIFSSEKLTGDEGIYINFAKNISQGYFTSQEDFNLSKSPGYPIVLSFFVLTGTPLVFAKYLNAIFLFLAIIYFYNLLLRYQSEKQSLIFTILLSLYFPFYSSLVIISPYPLIILIICGFIYHFIKSIEENNTIRNFLIASFYGGALIISKVLFAHIFLLFILLLLAGILLKRFTPGKAVLIGLCALIISTPYLFYTFSLTGKLFYWSDTYGSKIYWLSTPYENEYGDWHHSNHFNLYPELKKNHYDFWTSLENFNSIERDEILKAKAFENIYNHPLKFATNWLANTGRIFFSYPYSYTYQKPSTFFYLIPNFILIIIFFSAFIIKSKLKIKNPPEVKILFLLGSIFLLIRTFLSEDIRDSFLLIPFIILYISMVKAKIKLTSRESLNWT